MKTDIIQSFSDIIAKSFLRSSASETYIDLRLQDETYQKKAARILAIIEENGTVTKL